MQALVGHVALLCEQIARAKAAPPGLAAQAAATLAAVWRPPVSEVLVVGDGGGEQGA